MARNLLPSSGNRPGINPQNKTRPAQSRFFYELSTTSTTFPEHRSSNFVEDIPVNCLSVLPDLNLVKYLDCLPKVGLARLLIKPHVNKKSI